MKYLKLLLVFLLLIFPSASYSKTGKGDVKLSKETMEYLIMYMYGAGNTNYSADRITKNDPTIFALSKDGQAFEYFYCPAEYRAHGCMDNNTAARARIACEKYSNGVPCFTFAKKRRIVWKNGNKKVSIKKSDLKDPFLVAKKIQEAGFYDGDIRLLAGINLETGQADLNKKIDTSTKKEKSSSNETASKYELSGERSIALSWDGYSDLIAGTVSFDEADYRGKINLPLPNNDGTCDGSYSLQQNGKGTWQISCTNNMGAAGVLEWIRDGGVTGTGRDFKDKKVKFTVSSKS